jgi:hypothetical protein
MVNGFSRRASKRSLWGDDFPTDNLRKLEWVVRSPLRARIGLVAAVQRGGTVRGELTL